MHPPNHTPEHPIQHDKWVDALRSYVFVRAIVRAYDFVCSFVGWFVRWFVRSFRNIARTTGPRGKLHLTPFLCPAKSFRNVPPKLHMFWHVHMHAHVHVHGMVCYVRWLVSWLHQTGNIFIHVHRCGSSHDVIVVVCVGGMLLYYIPDGEKHRIVLWARAFVHACMRACVHACLCACVHACMRPRAFVHVCSCL
jgi:hypothetical protein